MTLFEITPDIQILAKPITPGWHPLELVKIEDSKGDDGVIKTVFTHKVLGPSPHKGAMVWVTIYHDERMAYNADYLDFQTNGAFSKPIKPGEKTKKELTIANVAHPKFDGQITNVIPKGSDRTMNNIKKYRKLGGPYDFKIEDKVAAGPEASK